MKSLKEFWTNSPPEHKDYLFIYAWGALWALVYLIFPPTATISVFSTAMVWLWTGTTILGGFLGVWGLVTRDNLLLERFGVLLLMAGPMAFALTQFGLLFLSVGDPFARLHLLFFALWPFLFLNKRRRQLNSRVRIVKKIPLVEESSN